MNKLIKYILLLSFLFLLLSANIPCLFAQDITGEIQGYVKDQKLQYPLTGVTIFLSGTNFAATTNYEGYFYIKKVPYGKYNIVVRYAGYKKLTQEIEINSPTNNLNFNLESTIIQKDEVITTGQGFPIEKQKMAYSTDILTSSDIDNAPVKSVDQLLQGRIPGLSVFNGSGFPGASSRLYSRGVKSGYSSSTPSIYIDGIRVDNNDNYRLERYQGGQVFSSLVDLIADEIDRVEFIKGGAAATLFGSDGGNGVVQIFTRKGIAGPGRWKISINSGFDAPENKYIKSQYTKDNYFQTGLYQGYGVNLSGGSDYVKYNFTGKAADNKGVIKDDQTENQIYYLMSSFKAMISENSSLEVFANWTTDKFFYVYNDASPSAALSALETEGLFTSYGIKNKDSLLRLYMTPELKNTVNRYMTGANLYYAPISGWDNKITFGIDYRRHEERQFAPIESAPIVNQTGGYLLRAERQYFSMTFGLLSSYKLPQIGDLNQTISLGIQAFRIEDRQEYACGYRYSIPGTDIFDNTAAIRNGESNTSLFLGGVFINDQIDLSDKLFFDIGVRCDGSSTFGKDAGIQTYPKAGVAYNFSKENFYPSFLKDNVQFLKLRASWGMTGLFPAAYMRDRMYASEPFISDVNSTINEAAIYFNNPGNKELKPEKISTFDIGFDAALFDEKLSLEFSYFNETTKDAFFFVPMDPASGFDMKLENLGEIKNSGIELVFKLNVLRTEDFMMDLNGSFATLSNEVSDMGGAPLFDLMGSSYFLSVVSQGHPVGVFQLTKPSSRNDGTYETILTGTPIPKQTGTIGIDFTLLKNLKISVLGEFALGHNVINQTLARKIINQQYYLEESSKLPKSSNSSVPYTINTASEILLEKADWFKIREVLFRYEVPQNICRGINLSLGIRNLLVLSSTDMVDPELIFNRTRLGLEVGGASGMTLSPPIQLRFGLEINL